MNNNENQPTEEKWYTHYKDYADNTAQYLATTKIAKFASSNAGALTYASLGLVFYLVVSGGTLTVPIIAAAALGGKTLKTVADARNIRKVRNLNIENNLLIEFATKAYTKQKILDLSPPKLKECYDKLAKAESQNNPVRKKSISEDRNNLENFMSYTDNLVTLVQNTAHHSWFGVAKQSYLTYNSIINAIGCLDNPEDLPTKLTEYLKDHPEEQKKFLKLIESQLQLDLDKIAYNDITELQQQINTLDRHIYALETTIKDKDFHKDIASYDTDSIQDISILQGKLQTNLEREMKEVYPLPQKESIETNTWYDAIKESLYETKSKPTPQYPTKFTEAVRKEKDADPAAYWASEPFRNTEKEQVITKQSNNIKRPHYIDDTLSTSLAEARKGKDANLGENWALRPFDTTEKEQMAPKQSDHIKRPHYIDDAFSTSLAEARKGKDTDQLDSKQEQDNVVVDSKKKTADPSENWALEPFFITTKKPLARPQAKKPTSKGYQR